MNVVIGRGKARKVWALPHGSVFAQAAKGDTASKSQCRQVVGEVCNLLGVE